MPADAAYDVFLSYARADDDPDYDDPAKSLLRRLYDDLRGEFAVWWDRASLPSRGLSFGPEIEQAIQHSERFVLIAAPGAAASAYVQAELRCALRLCKPVTVVLCAGDYDLIPPEIERVNAIDFRPPRAYAAALTDLRTRLLQPAPIGKPINVKSVPSFYVERQKPFADAHAVLCADAIAPAVISAAQPRAAVVYGYGGIGKSTLAAALAHDCTLRRLYPSGIVWVEIGQQPTMQTRLADIGVHLGDSREHYTGAGTDEQTAQSRLSWWLHETQARALIILDDVWDANIVGLVPVQDTPCRLLITTRSGALARKIDGADIRLDLMTPDEGAALVAGRVGGDAGDPTYKRIAILLNGHTLAIALAAAQVVEGYADSAADMLRLLGKGDNLLCHLAVDTDDKNENVEVSLGLSYRALPSDMQRRFRALGVFAREASFDRAALAAVWGDADADDAAARGAVSALVGAGLLDETETRGRYQQHRLLHAYARALLASKREYDAAFECYAEYFIEFAEQFDTLPFTQWRKLDAEIIHIRLIGNMLTKSTMIGTQGDLGRTLNFARNIIPIRYHYPLPDGFEWLEMGLNCAKSPEDTAIFLNELGLVCSTLGNFDQAFNYHIRSLEARRRIGNRRWIATALNNIGDLYRLEGNLQQALQNYDASLQLSRLEKDIESEALALNNLGDVYERLEAHDQALSHYSNALSLMRTVGNREGEIAVLNNLSYIYAKKGHLETSINNLQEVVAVANLSGNVPDKALYRYNLGVLLSKSGRKVEAVQQIETALALLDSIGLLNDSGGTSVEQMKTFLAQLQDTLPNQH